MMVLVLSFASATYPAYAEEPSKSFIRWVDNNVTYEVLLSAYEYEIRYHNDPDVDFHFVKALAYLATRNGNKFTQGDIKALSDYVLMLQEGKKADDFYGSNKYYRYYTEAYGAIFDEFIGEYTVAETGESGYGLKNYHPFPKGYWYNHSDDFGNSRSYGFRRKHLGHDMMGSVGTPICAVEGGIVTELGWNRYGGWRIGIRSFDGRRSYYYAHLRKNKPYIENLRKGNKIAAGQVIGYLGVTGYSTKENVNMSCPPHLHIGMQLIFDESQYQGPTEIWVDMYAVTKFLSHNRPEVCKDGNDYKTKNLKISQ
jgi:murein DD-endopeptidase MepM/ murein hydrolase activator NlpD